MWVPEEEHGKHLRKSAMLTECFKVFSKWIRVSGAHGPPLTSLTVSALMVANKSVRVDWQRAGYRSTFSTSLYLFPHFLWPVAAACALVL